MTMEEKIDFLINSFMEMKEEITSMKQDITDMQKEITGMKKDIKELKEDVDTMNRNIIIIEDDTSNKIPALFDGYSFHQQHIEEHDKRIDTLEIKVDNHSNRLWALESSN